MRAYKENSFVSEKLKNLEKTLSRKEADVLDLER